METEMTQTDKSTELALSTDPMLANIGELTESEYELVYLYGFIGKVTDETLRLHQGLDLRRYYEIPRCGIVHHEVVACGPDGPSTKLVVYSTTRITYVSTVCATLPASSLAAVIAARNRKFGKNPKTEECYKCKVGCCCNGSCKCATVDYWIHLDKETAKKLGVEILGAPSGLK
jgi:hypothetical protein